MIETNNCLFRKLKVDTRFISSHSLNFFREFQLARGLESQVVTEAVLPSNTRLGGEWCKPMPNIVKVNCDASRYDKGFTGIGIVLRNDLTEVMGVGVE